MSGNKKRKPRSDSTSEKSKIIQSASKEILPPPHVRLSKEEMPFWDAIIKEFSKSELTEHILEMSAMLARSMYGLENEQYFMRKEGSVINVKNAQGKVINKKVNPRKQLIEMHSKSVLSLRRSLSLHARGRIGEPRDIARRRVDAKDLESLMDDIDDDGLLARPPKSMQ